MPPSPPLESAAPPPVAAHLAPPPLPVLSLLEEEAADRILIITTPGSSLLGEGAGEGAARLVWRRKKGLGGSGARAPLSCESNRVKPPPPSPPLLSPLPVLLPLVDESLSVPFLPPDDSPSLRKEKVPAPPKETRMPATEAGVGVKSWKMREPRMVTTTSFTLPVTDVASGEFTVVLRKET